MKTVWFVSHYSMPPEYEMRIKTQMYAYYLNLKGFKTRIFSASTIHNTKINLITSKDKYICRSYNDIDFVHIKCHDYEGNGLMRIRNMLEFSAKFSRIAYDFEIPDVIVADVNCINYGLIYRFCKKNKIKFYIDVRDLWPMSIVEYYKYSESNPIIKYLYHREKNMYRNANGVIFSMEGGIEYIKEKGWLNYLKNTDFHYINNGVDLIKFYQDIDKNTITDSDLDDIGSFKVIYTGSIRTANNLKTIVDAALEIKRLGYSKIKFLIYGDGDNKTDLEIYSKNLGLNNIFFKGFIEKKYIPYVLSKSDLCILNYINANTLKYGGSQNKLFEYLAVGKPIIVTVKMNYDIVEKNNCGISLENPDAVKIAESIIKIYNLDESERINIGNNSKTCVKDYDFEVLADKLIKIIN